MVSHGADNPSGDNLEYDPDFTALALAAQPGEERQAGKEILAAEEPDHKDVIAKALVVLGRSHDLRAAVQLALSELRLNGFTGFARATGYVRGCLEQFWDTCHPQLDADDDNDPTMRVNAVLAMADTATMLRAVRLVPLTHSVTFGRITLRDILVAEGEIPLPADMTKAPDPAAIVAAFKDTKPDVLKGTLAAARTCYDDVKAIDLVFDTRTPGEGPTLDPLLKMLKRVVARLAAEVGEPEAEAVAVVAAPTDAPATAAPMMAAAPGTIASRRDVLAALDRIIAYYATYEPSSPLPLLLLRAHRLVGADFLTILKDMAPGGVENAHLIGGIEEN